MPFVRKHILEIYAFTILKENCQTLKEYMQYVNLIRQYTYHKKLELKEAEYQYGVESGMETGLKQGIEQGRKFYLIQSICKKLHKNKDA